MNEFRSARFLSLVIFVVLAFYSNAKSAVTTAQDDKVVLRILDIQTNAADFWDVVIPIFQQEYPHIVIEQESVAPDIFSSVRTARITNGDVDIVAGQPQNDLYTEASRSLYLSLEGQAFLNNFYPDIVEQVTIDDKPYIVPTAADGVVVFYNKDIFAELNLSVPLTWSEFIQACETIQNAGIPPILFGGLQQWPIALHIIALETNIVRPVDPDFYEGIRSGETAHDGSLWVEIFEKLEILSSYYQEFSVGQDHNQIPNLFAIEEGAMIISNFPDAGAISRATPEFEVGVFTLPGSENPEHNRYISTKVGVGYMIVKTSPNVEEALAFLEFFSRPDIYQIYIDVTGEFPVQPTAIVKDPTMKTIIEIIEEAEYGQLMIWEQLVIPGALYDFDPLGIAVVSHEMTGREAAEKMQQNIISSREDWEDAE